MPAIMNLLRAWQQVLQKDIKQQLLAKRILFVTLCTIRSTSKRRRSLGNLLMLSWICYMYFII
uniref:Uncharacterized protein n=1 Tax=Arundo donax TaxID=35708 RepID=A0A0A9DI88_ARUDO